MKTAISIPDRLFNAAERAAKRQKVSRSRFYARAVEAYLKTQQAKGAKEALNAVYASEPCEPDPFLAAAAYHIFSKENWNSRPMAQLEATISELFGRPETQYSPEYFDAFNEFKSALNEGRVRAAEPDAASPTGWKVNPWVKKGILLGFRLGRVVQMGPADFQFCDKHTFPLKHLPASQNVRVVPGGSSIRDGCYIGKNVTCMPPMYVNVGAYVDDGAMIDSHALVGSCAQVGKRVHLSAAAQIGGVLEPDRGPARDCRG